MMVFCTELDFTKDIKPNDFKKVLFLLLISENRLYLLELDSKWLVGKLFSKL